MGQPNWNNIRQRARIIAKVNSEQREWDRQARESRRSWERLFRGETSSRRSSASGSGRGTLGVLVIGILIGAGILSHGSKTDPPTTAVPTSAVAPSQQAAPYQAQPYAAPYAPPSAPPAPVNAYQFNQRSMAARPSMPEEAPAPVVMPTSAPNVALAAANQLDSGAQVVAMTNPRYPAMAIRQHHEGTVQLLITVGADGMIQNATVQTSSGFAELDRSAIEAVQRWHFQPAVSHSMAVTSQVSVPIQFNLNNL